MAQVAHVLHVQQTQIRLQVPRLFLNAYAMRDTTGLATRVLRALPGVVQASTRVQIVPLPLTSRVLIAQQTPIRWLARRRLHNARATLDFMDQVAHAPPALQTPTQLQEPRQSHNAHATRDTTGLATPAQCALPAVLQASTRVQTAPLPPTSHVQAVWLATIQQNLRQVVLLAHQANILPQEQELVHSALLEPTMRY